MCLDVGDTYKDEQGIDIVCEVRDHVFIVAQNSLLDEVPTFQRFAALQFEYPFAAVEQTVYKANGAERSTHLSRRWSASSSYRRHRVRRAIQLRAV